MCCEKGDISPEEGCCTNNQISNQNLTKHLSQIMQLTQINCQTISESDCSCSSLIFTIGSMSRMSQGISHFKKFERNQEGLMGSCQLLLQWNYVLILECFGRIRTTVASQRQFFQAWFHQLLGKGSPSNVLPFCCATTCVISQFIALWVGSFYHERFSPPPSPSHSCSLAPTVIRSPLCSALFAAAQVL